MFSLFSIMMIFQKLLIKSNFLDVVVITNSLFIHCNVINVFGWRSNSILYPDIIVYQVKFIHCLLAEIPSNRSGWLLGFFFDFLYTFSSFFLAILLFDMHLAILTVIHCLSLTVVLSLDEFNIVIFWYFEWNLLLLDSFLVCTWLHDYLSISKLIITLWINFIRLCTLSELIYTHHLEFVS